MPIDNAREEEARSDSSVSQPVRRCIVVAIGVRNSADERLDQLVATLPAGSGLGYVLLLPPESAGETSTLERLRALAPMPISIADDGASIDEENIYLLPRNQISLVDSCSFHFLPADDEQNAVDTFLMALAEDQGENAVGILIGEVGDDGPRGCEAIRGEGGMTILVTGEDRPRNLRDEQIEHVVPPDRVPELLVSYSAHLYGILARRSGRSLESDVAEQLDRICSILRRRTGHDFSRYKRGTLTRRVLRRMQILGVASVHGYIELLRREPSEVRSLFRDLLISVTRFFRDPEVFEAVAAEVIPQLLERREEGPIRIWVPACATGEEAYSLAILLREALGSEQLPRVQIFATDLDEAALDVARQARYPASIANDVGPERLERYFVPQGEQYQVAADIRELCVFSTHNLIKDPPFSRIDLVSCRNLLIYMESDLQKRILPLLHYALRPGGFLVLGPSENVLSAPELFRAVDKKHRIFRRKETVIRPGLRFPLSDPISTAPHTTPGSTTADQGLSRTIERVLLENFAPPSLVINERNEILYYSGRTGRFLEPSAGTPTTNVISMVRRELRLPLRTLLHRATTSRRTAVEEGIAIDTVGGSGRINLVVRPMLELGEEAGLFMVIFQESAQSVSTMPTPAPAADGETSEHPAIRQLENELMSTRERLQATVEELETSNAELLSMNEELQSSNEEMQTSKEELQSINEELETVNAELQKKLDELDAANSDLNNFLVSTQKGVLFLDRQLMIRKFTPAAIGLFRLIDGDIGRPITDIATDLVGVDFAKEATLVLQSLERRELEVRTADGDAWYILRVLPYRTIDEVIDGVVMTFTDITELKRAQEDQAKLAAIVQSTEDAILGLTLEGEITSWNDAAQRTYGFSSREAVGRTLDLIVPEERRGEIRQILDMIGRGLHVPPFTTTRLRRDGSHLNVSLTISPVLDSTGTIVGASAIHHDVTRLKRAEEEAQHRAEQLRTMADALPVLISFVGQDERYRFCNAAYRDWFGLEPEDIIGRHVSEVVGDDAYAVVRGLIDRTLAGERIRAETELPYHRGGTRMVQIDYIPLVSAGGEVSGYFAMISDVTAQRRTAEALATSERRYRSLVAATTSLVWITDSEGRFVEAQQEWESYTGQPFVEHQGWGWLDMVHADDREMVRRRWTFALSRGEVYEVTCRLRHGESGGYRWVIARGVPVTTPGGDVREWVGTITDIHEPRVGLERNRLLLESMPQVVWTSDSNGNATYFNRQWLEYTGLSLEESINGAWDDMIHPDDRPHVVDLAQRSIATGKAFEMEYRLRRRDGVYRWFLGRMLPLTAADGSILQWLGSATEVHERRRWEERQSVLAEASRLLGSSLDQGDVMERLARYVVPRLSDWCLIEVHASEGMPDVSCIVGIDEERRADWVELRRRYPVDGQRTNRLFEVVGEEVVHLESIDDASLGRLVGDDEHREGIRRLKIGSVIFAPIRTAGGIIGTITLANDLDRVPLDVGDRELVEDIARRTAVALEHSRLYTEAEEANRAKDKFLAVLSHELRTPLTPTLAAIEALEEGAASLPKDLQPLVEVIRRNVALEARLIDDLLDLTRIIRGRLPLTMEHVDLHALIRLVVEICGPDIAAHRQQLIADLTAEHAVVKGDPARLQQVLWNIVKNGVKFTPDEGAITIRTWREEGEIVVEVSDTGVGIAPEALEVIFDAFEQGPSIHSRRLGGLGLGLAISRSIVELHGGRISAASGGDDTGATFTVRLPATQGTSIVERGDSHGTTAPTEPTKGLRVLLVDDHADTLRIMQVVLEKKGYRVETARSVADALERARRTEYDLCISDIGLPDGTGHDLLRQLREVQGAPAIAVSGYGTEADLERSRAAGFAAHLVKPFSMATLYEAIERVLDGGS